MKYTAGMEIERKFLVVPSKLPELDAFEWQSLRQGYLHTPLAARVRKSGKGVLIVQISKGKSYNVTVPAADVPGIQLAIEQRAKNPSVRIRLSKSKKGKEAWITLKGRSAVQLARKNKTKAPEGSSGYGKTEFEYVIPYEEALALFKKCDHALSKVRYHVPFGGYVWDLDEYVDDHESLWTAEVELQNENEEVKIPPWCGQEVTGHPSLTNHNLAKESKIPKDVVLLQRRLVALARKLF